MRPVLVLVLSVFLPAVSLAGTYVATPIDGAVGPNSFRVEIAMTADLEGQCPDYTCAWCCTAHTVRITPAPVDIAPWMSPVGTDPNLFSWDMSEADGTGSYWVDLDVAEATIFSEQRTKALWQPLVSEDCDIDQQCYRIDGDFPILEISGPAVSDDPRGWGGWKAWY